MTAEQLAAIRFAARKGSDLAALLDAYDRLRAACDKAIKVCYEAQQYVLAREWYDDLETELAAALAGCPKEG